MPAQIPRPIGAIAFASVLLASGLAVNVPANTALAVDCLTAPNSSAPPNSHWYYRTDRMQQRKCWYLRANSEPSEQTAVQVAARTPTAVRSGQRIAWPAQPRLYAVSQRIEKSYFVLDFGYVAAEKTKHPDAKEVYLELMRGRRELADQIEHFEHTWLDRGYPIDKA